MTKRVISLLTTLFGTAAFIAAGATPGTASQAPLSQRQAPERCPMHFIGVHGMDETGDDSETIKATWDKFRDLSPEPKPASYFATYRSIHKDDLNSTRAAISKWSGIYKASTLEGVTEIGLNVAETLRRCPSTHFVLAGYSQGAWVVDEYLRQSHTPLGLIDGVALYGDPQWDHGAKGKGLARRLTKPQLSGDYPDPPNYQGHILTLCANKDPICGEGYGDLGVGVQLIDASNCKKPKCPHLTYAPTATNRGAEFLASKAFKKNKIDWKNLSYQLTCDDVVDKPVRVNFRNGKGTVRPPGIGGHDRWDVEVQRVAQGSLPGLGNVTGVLFACSPQPSNFTTQEMRIYRSDDGAEIGRIPSISGANGMLPPEYQPNSVSIGNNRITADLKFYGPGDAHGEPSILRHLTWIWNGQSFVKKSEVNAVKIDLSRQQVTVNGIGPLKIDMTRAQAQQAIGAGIPDGPGGPTCKDFTATGGPEGLLLRFDNSDRLVAVSVHSPASISTASGIHVGSTREEVLTTYSGQAEEPDPDHLVFTPSGAQFRGKVINFAMDGDRVDTFIAGKEAFADPLPCGSD
ncbi:cutinase family protein [Streptomyces sp. NPDC000618]|uniref:cutinase family protein n=1 Tax=Streptomyces sp. NPDC000618 TaxID=3154265 RepID=UPI0033348BC9